jgi:hypothetical protein
MIADKWAGFLLLLTILCKKVYKIFVNTDKLFIFAPHNKK